MNKPTWLLIVILLVLLFPLRVFAQQVCQQQDLCANKSLQDQPACYQTVVDACKNQRETLAGQINLMNNQIRLTTLRIESTKDIISKLSSEINDLGNEITRLEGVLTQRSELLLRRIPQSYKRASVSNVGLLFLSHTLPDFINRAKYLAKVQEQDASILFQVKATQNNFTERKTLREDKKNQQEQAKRQLEQQNAQLAQQKRDKQTLLEETQNSETKYQQLLASALAENAVAAGLGKETFLRDVAEGEKIGRIIPSASGCSSGEHLHFEVHQGTSIQDPNNFLRSISFSYGYGFDQYSYYGTINPRGSWNWPIEEPIEIEQGFGTHGFARIYYADGIHKGIDMVSKTSTIVKAVKNGKLYGGSYQCKDGTLLYAKVDQGDGIMSWYLHMVPQ